MALCARSILHVAQWFQYSLFSLFLSVSRLDLAGRWARAQRRTHRSWRASLPWPSKCLGCRRSLAPAGHGAV